MKFRFVEEHRETFRIRKMCEVLEVSRSGFYAWLHRQPSGRAREDEAIAVHIREVHRRSHETYGSPRIYAELRDEGKGWGRHRVARIMRANGIESERKRGFRKTTDSNHSCRSRRIC